MLLLRRYLPSDWAQVWELHVEALSRLGAYAGEGPWNDDMYDIENVYLKRGEFIVGTEDNRIVAMGALRPTSATRAEVKRMRVHPEFQGRGYGQIILSRLETRAVELGFEILHLDTSDKQEAAQKLYLKNRYRETARKQWQGMTVMFYEKDLRPERVTDHVPPSAASEPVAGDT